ncbi:MAG: hypothetical protein QXU88_02790 [Candidatus Woesearchaeota archaeon]
MVERTISKSKYILAALITGVIFLLGIALGLVIEGKRVTYVQDFMDSQRIEFTSSQLQYSYLKELNRKDDCPAIYEIFYSNLRNLERTGARLEGYAVNSKINDEAFNRLKREYVLEELRYWLLAKQAKELCEDKFITMLYFYSDDEHCPRCGDQEFVLNYLKKAFEQKLLIFSLDERLNEPMILILKKQYNLTTFPTLIVEEKKYAGFTSKDILLKELCSRLDAPPCEALRK